MTLKTKTTEANWTARAVVAFLLILVVYLAFLVFSAGWIAQCTPDLQRLALLGDAHGIMNTLFSALAFGAVVIALMMQREDLRLVHEDNENARRVFETQWRQMRDGEWREHTHELLRGYRQAVEAVTRRVNLSTEEHGLRAIDNQARWDSRSFEELLREEWTPICAWAEALCAQLLGSESNPDVRRALSALFWNSLSETEKGVLALAVEGDSLDTDHLRRFWSSMRDAPDPASSAAALRGKRGGAT